MLFETMVGITTIACVYVGAFVVKRKTLVVSLFAGSIILAMVTATAAFKSRDALDPNLIDAMIGIMFLIVFSTGAGLLAAGVRSLIDSYRQTRSV